MSDTPPPVLVADDDTAVRRTLAALLAHAGFAVTPAADGTEALALLTEPGRGFAAAVLDCRLSGLSGPNEFGYSAISRIRVGSYPLALRRRGRVVRQRPAKPRTPVRFRSAPLPP